MNLPAIHHCDCDVCVLRFNLCFFCDSPSAQELPPWGVSSLSIHRYRLRGFQPWEIGGLGFQLNCVLRAQCLMLQLLDKESCSNSAGFMGSFFFVNPWFDDSMAQFWWAIFVVLKVGLVWSSILRTHLLSPWVLWTLSGIRLSPVLVRRVRRAGVRLWVRINYMHFRTPIFGLYLYRRGIPYWPPLLMFAVFQRRDQHRTHWSGFRDHPQNNSTSCKEILNLYDTVNLLYSIAKCMWKQVNRPTFQCHTRDELLSRDTGIEAMYNSPRFWNRSTRTFRNPLHPDLPSG